MKLSFFLLLAGSLTLMPRAEARPFRAMTTRTAVTTDPQHLEFGLRFQGFLLGDTLNSLSYASISPGVRFGIVDKLELNLYLDVMLLSERGFGTFNAYVGDVPIGLQYTIVSTQHFALGVWGRLTVPAGASSFERLAISLQDRIPPSFSDGT